MEPAKAKMTNPLNSAVSKRALMTTCDAKLCQELAVVGVSWLTSCGQETITLCDKHARELWEELKEFPAHETGS